MMEKILSLELAERKGRRWDVDFSPQALIRHCEYGNSAGQLQKNGMRCKSWGKGARPAFTEKIRTHQAREFGDGCEQFLKLVDIS